MSALSIKPKVSNLGDYWYWKKQGVAEYYKECYSIEPEL
jgi:hypothetical protein